MKVDYWPPEEDLEGGMPGELIAEVTDADEVHINLGPVGGGETADAYLSGLKAIEFGQALIAAGTQAVTDQVAKVKPDEAVS
jgi:hypothetical protein